MRGKLAENVKFQSLLTPERMNSATLFYNGQSITSASGYGIDTQGYDNISFFLSIGTVVGEAVTLSHAVYESDTDDPTAATAISGASFTDRYDGNDETTEEASLLCKDYKRYLFLRTQIQGGAPTVDAAAFAVLGKPDSAPVSKTLIFDL